MNGKQLAGGRRPRRAHTLELRCAVCALVGLGLAAALAARGMAQEKPDAPAAARIATVVSILPQACFVERVGGQHVSVEVLVAPGQSPHTFEPTPRQVAALAQARLYFTIGVPFEETLARKARSSFPNLKIVDTRAGIKLRRYTAAEGGGEDADHDHDHAGHAHDEHAAGEPDPHTWLDPRNAKIHAKNICDALCAAAPDRADEFRRNLAAFEADLDRVHEKLSQTLAPLKGREFYVFHPAFGYFADAYGLRQAAVEIEGKEPTARQLRDLIERAKAAKVRVIFVQPQFPSKSAEVVAKEIGGAVVPMDDLPRDYLKALEETAERLRAALAPETK